MNYRNLFGTMILCLFCGIGSDAVAQPPGGDPGGFAGRMLRRLDRDENGSLDPDELDRAGPLKDFLARQNVDVSRPVPLGLVADHQAGMFQEMRERGEFPGGFGGPPGGFGGPPGGPLGGDNPSEVDRRSTDSGSRGRRGEESGRTDGNSNSNSKEERRSARTGRRGETAGAGGTPNAPPGKADAKSKVRVGRVGPKVNLPPATLPAQYASRDINQDGQIGMYEWSRTDLSSFRKLDLNGDGFVTPAELVAPGAGTGGGSTTVASTTPSGGGYGGKAVPAAASKSASSPSEPPADLKTVAAQGAFDLLDTDKNGQLSDDEWNRSRYAKKLFTEAKAEFKLPLPKSNFVETYKKLAP